MSQPHGGQLLAIAHEFNLDPAALIDFSASINPDGPPAAVLPALQAALADPHTLTQYPDLEERTLKSSIVACNQINTSQVAVANGFVPLLEAALHLLKPRRCLVPVPAFVEYRNTLTRTKTQVTPLALDSANNFAYPHHLATGNHDAILLANPQNPTAIGTGYDSMLAILESARAKNKLVFLDEAFIDYLPQASLTRDTLRFPNLIVFRSVTKFHAMPGMRVAYAVAHPDLIASLNARLPPWPITTLASIAVQTALADSAYTLRTLKLNQERREAFAAGLRSLGLLTYPSSANFLLFRTPEGIDAATLRRRLILEHGFILRDCSNFEGLAPNHLRAAVRTQSENDRLVQALAACR